jgi:hypothetical protein
MDALTVLRHPRSGSLGACCLPTSHVKCSFHFRKGHVPSNDHKGRRKFHPPSCNLEQTTVSTHHHHANSIAVDCVFARCRRCFLRVSLVLIFIWGRHGWWRRRAHFEKQARSTHQHKKSTLESTFGHITVNSQDAEEPTTGRSCVSFHPAHIERQDSKIYDRNRAWDAHRRR